ncbi:MAG: SpoIVB peptidase [Lachnospiraceae bacterium]|nr:SpoIVB peptidase [Lachnospiraceae bacterium]
MKKYLIAACKRLFFVWILWSILLTGYELIRLKIPEIMHIYEEEAVTVLSGNDKNIDPELLHLDFAGNIQITETVEGTYEASCKLFGMIPLKSMEIQVVSKEQVIPGGIPVGIYVQTDGVFVIGTGEIETNYGNLESPAKNIIKTGDYITSFQGAEIKTKEELVEKLAKFSEKELVLGIRRNQETFNVAVHPVLMEDGAHLGLWVRDDTQGVGTLTYITADKKFGALGHGISDTDSQLLIEVSEGKIYDCEILAIIKGESGIPGKLSGKIVYSKNNLYGDVEKNLSGGIYGNANEHLMGSVDNVPVSIALKQEVEEGEASILCSVDGNLKEYTVEVRKIHRGEEDVNKGMELMVTDEELLELTGGIVQGMSGSPILQNGKIIGALTHVFVNEPTKGYGIFIENMLE